MPDDPDKLTPEEYEILANSPADAPVLPDDPDVTAADAPDGVVEDAGE
jgi:hypothetical protein